MEELEVSMRKRCVMGCLLRCDIPQKWETPYEGGIAYLDFSSSPPVRSIFGYGLTILYILRLLLSSSADFAIISREITFWS